MDELARSDLDEEYLIRQYSNQLVYGCQRSECTNPFCASNPTFQSLVAADEVLALASTLARAGTQFMCQNNQQKQPSPLEDASMDASSDVKALDLDSLRLLIDQCESSGSWTPLTRTIYTVFSEAHLLSTSFRLNPAHIIKPDQELVPTLTPTETVETLDLKALDEGYDLIFKKAPSSMCSTLASAIASMLDKLKSMTKVGYPSIDALVMILDSPIVMDDSKLLTFSTSGGGYDRVVMSRWCEVVASLAEDDRILLQKRIRDTRLRKGDPKDAFQKITNVVQHYLTMRMYHVVGQFAGEALSPNKDEGVQNAVKSLALLHEINDEMEWISYTEFYNDAVNEHLEIKEDFPVWKAKEGFSFCHYPFVLTAATKSDILRVESMVQMRHELQDAFFRAMFIGVNSPYLVLEIRRDHIIRDALYHLESRTAQDLKKQLKIQFVGEEAVDEGGVQKEFFQLAVRELFDPKYGIFKENEDSRLHWFNFHLDDPSTLQELKLAGQLIGLAIYNGVILNIDFPLALYKKLAGKNVGLNDLKDLDPMLGKNLETLLTFDGDVESTFAQTFQIEYKIYDTVFTHDLIPNAAQTPLTNQNRREYVDRYVDFLLSASIQKAFDQFCEGFSLVCKGTAISLFRPEEIQLLVCGASDLDFEALKANTSYDGGYDEETPVIRHFWEIVTGEFSEDQKKRLLFFATGSDRVPIGGLAKLGFVIAKSGPDSDRLPSSHTCFNVLLLPEYKEKDKLRDRLVTAIQNAEGFGMI